MNSRSQLQRRALIIAGSRDWCAATAEQYVRAAAYPDTHWFGEHSPQGISSSQGAAAFSKLGGELDVLVFDAWSGFDPDAFGVLTGTIRGGGLLLLLTPPLREWPDFVDPQNQRITVAPFSADQLSGYFIQRMVRILRDAPQALLCEQGSGNRLPAPVSLPPVGEVSVQPTDEQQCAVEALLRVARGHRRRPVVLISDRGRGKSAAFGFAAAALMRTAPRRILLTAPRLKAVDSVFEHARRALPRASQRAGFLQLGQATLEFMAPDELVQGTQRADMLLVDEAAAIPASLLQNLLKRFARIAFATTVHGYEGTGRGFAIRFSSILDRYTNGWKRLQLETPVRWAPADPLEQLVFRMLALDASAAPDHALQGLETDECQYLQLDRKQLAQDESLLAELFGLLVLAHYRTRPLDLRHLLDGPNLSVRVVLARGHVVATALTAAEGGFGVAEAHAIWTGERRPRGHLLPETLAAHYGLKEAPTMNCVRLMRIAVHPAVQSMGIGSELIRNIVAEARRNGADYAGSSFGATPGLLRFWKKQGWMPVRLGMQRGSSSGEHSALLLQALNAKGTALVTRARERFLFQFPHQLGDSLRDLEPELVAEMMQGTETVPQALSDYDVDDLKAFAFERRQLEVIIASVWKLACMAFADRAAMEQLSEQQGVVLATRVLQRKPWKEVVAQSVLTGKRQALELLRGAIAELLRFYSL